LTEDIHGVLSIGDSRDIEHGHSIGSKSGDEETIIHRIKSNTERLWSRILCYREGIGREVRLTEDIHGIFPIDYGSNIEDEDTTIIRVCDVEAIIDTIIDRTHGGAHSRTRDSGCIRQKVWLTEDKISEVVERLIISIEIVDEDTIILTICDEESMVDRIDSHWVSMREPESSVTGS
jgi:hypothetical protein